MQYISVKYYITHNFKQVFLYNANKLFYIISISREKQLCRLTFPEMYIKPAFMKGNRRVHGRSMPNASDVYSGDTGEKITPSRITRDGIRGGAFPAVSVERLIYLPRTARQKNTPSRITRDGIRRGAFPAVSVERFIYLLRAARQKNTPSRITRGGIRGGAFPAVSVERLIYLLRTARQKNNPVPDNPRRDSVRGVPSLVV